MHKAAATTDEIIWPVSGSRTGSETSTSGGEPPVECFRLHASDVLPAIGIVLNWNFPIMLPLSGQEEFH